MADIIELLNLYLNLGTRDSVRNTEALLLQSELVRQNNNAKLNNLVELYARGREYKNQRRELEAFTALIIGKRLYVELFQKVTSAEIKLRMTEIDEKCDTLMNQLLDNADARGRKTCHSILQHAHQFQPRCLDSVI